MPVQFALGWGRNAPDLANLVDRAFQPSDIQSGAQGAPSEARPEALLSLGELNARMSPGVTPSESASGSDEGKRGGGGGGRNPGQGDADAVELGARSMNGLRRLSSARLRQARELAVHQRRRRLGGRDGRRDPARDRVSVDYQTVDAGLSSRARRSRRSRWRCSTTRSTRGRRRSSFSGSVRFDPGLGGAAGWLALTMMAFEVQGESIIRRAWTDDESG